ncbi:SusC/RagA family TonB-linked outer membrane protein [Niastella sp. OAS944]|uniref:SusC/RagA family TonB-linked outer membrane protein n=1 Tax=Niastella sp. OAS944 TaxID=2664089 RepID=UPI00347EFC43|nr:TonB-linked SusC/RagA family outer membrane protein [Chitinophagaceae bacterium OAS944]
MRHLRHFLLAVRAMSVCAFLLLCHHFSYGQAQLVSGIVTNTDGAPLESASVVIKGTSQGTATDASGKFTLRIPGDKATLVISRTGFTDLTIVAKAGIQVMAKLANNTNDMEQVVVVAYGKQKKGSVVGSVAQINGDELKKAPTMNVTNMLAGRVPGLVAVQQSGRPGNDDAMLRIRGVSSYVSSGPLIIIDNVQRPSFSNLDPSEIESVTFLKDAVSTAVYGLQAANGIILITTKRGKNQKPSVSYDGAVTVNSNTRFPKFLNGPDYMTWYNKGVEMDNDYNMHTSASPVAPLYTQEQIDAVRNGTNTNPLLGNTDWVGMLAGNNATSQQHSITVRGGSEKIKFFSSLSYFDQDGVVKNTDYKRYNARTNVDAQLNDIFSASLDLAVRQQLGNTPGIAPDNDAYMNPFYQAVRMLPNLPEYAPNGLPVAYRAGAGWVNPIAAVEQSGYQKRQENVFQGNMTFNVKAPWVKGLEGKLLVAYDRNITETKNWLSPYQMMGRDREKVTGDFELVPNPPGITKTTLRQAYSQYNRKTFQPSITYNNTFGDHNVNALALYEWSQYQTNNFSTGASNFAIADLQQINYGSKDQLDWISPTGFDSVERRAGYVVRLNYSFKDKYLFEVANRWDASIRFAPKNRWKAFPGVGLGWVISKESFFDELSKTVSFLKLKASYGKMGAEWNVPPFSYMATYGLTPKPVYVFGGSPVAGLYTNAVPNPDLRWETSSMINGGFESVFLNGLLGVDLEFFYKKTDDILADVTALYPSSLGGYYPSRLNYGKVDNRGFDLQIRHNHHIGEFQYGVTGNLNWSRNKIIRRNEQAGLPEWMRTVGRRVGEKVGFVVEGMYQNWEEASNGISPSGGDVAPGFFKYKDLNGDGRLTRTDDMTFIGRANTPELMFGLNIDLKYKGFDFSALIQGATLCNVSLAGTYEGSSNVSGIDDNTPFTKTFYNFGNSPYYLVEDSWTPDNPGAKFPRLSSYKATLSAHNAHANSGWVRDGSYVRLKSAQLGYTIPAKWLSAAKLKQVRFYVSGFNLFTWDKLKYLDPEMPNVNNGFYPQQRMVSGGVNITL